MLKESLAKVQLELNVPKNQFNEYGNFHYRSCEDILIAVKPLLSKYGLILAITDDVVNVGNRNYIKATVGISEIASNTEKIIVEAFAREAESKTKMDDAQITGSASSYARKYALNGLFLIDDVKDPDHTNKGDGGSNTPPKAQKPVESNAGAVKSQSVKVAEVKKSLEEVKDTLTVEELEAQPVNSIIAKVKGTISDVKFRDVGKSGITDFLFLSDDGQQAVTISRWSKANTGLSFGDHAEAFSIVVSEYQGKKQFMATVVKKAPEQVR